jgi:protein SCO1/2
MITSLLQFLATNVEEPSNDLKIADRFANVSLVNQFGQRMAFCDAFIDGRALIINTMFTVCRGTCPGTSSTIRQLREDLSPLFGNKLTFLSITLDPERDSPAALKDYAELYGADSRRPELCDWHFLTGKPTAIDELRRSLEFYDLNPKVDNDITQHAALILFGNTKTDRWASLPSGLRKPLLIEAIRRVCGFTFEQKYGIPG